MTSSGRCAALQRCAGRAYERCPPSRARRRRGPHVNGSGPITWSCFVTAVSPAGKTRWLPGTRSGLNGSPYNARLRQHVNLEAWTASGLIALRATGTPLGLMPGMRYEEREAILAPGDHVYVTLTPLRWMRRR